MTPNIRNGSPVHLSDIEIDKIRKAVYKILVERCTIEEANAVFKPVSVSALYDRLIEIICK